MSDTNVNPSWLRRMLMMAVYIVVLFVFWVLLQYFLLSGRCFLYNDCSDVDRTVRMSISIFCIAGGLMVVYLGTMSRLWGARRKAQDR